MAHLTTPPTVIVKVAREQHGYPPSKAICPWCGQPGATEPHHWLLKRSSYAPPKVLHDPINVVLLHYRCHELHGQTEAMVQRCYQHKIKKLFYQEGQSTLSGRPYDITGWLKELRVSRLLIHVPILPILEGQEENFLKPKLP